MIADQAFANELLQRLNALLATDGARDFVSALVSARVPVGADVADHPTIQVVVGDGKMTAGFLGLLNGLIGTLPGGYVAAHYDDETGRLTHFALAQAKQDKPGGKP